MDALKNAISRAIQKLKKGAFRQGKRIRAYGRRTSRTLRTRLKAMDAQRRTLILGGGAVACTAIIALAIILTVNGISAETDTLDLDSENVSAERAVQNDLPDVQAVAVPVQTPTPTPTPTPVPTPTPTPDPTLKRGIEREEVADLQLRLMELGFMDQDEPTQKFGPATENAVRLFQRQVNFTDTIDVTLEEDGIAGEKTLALIYSDSAPHYIIKYGMEGDDITEVQEQLKDLGYMSAVTGYYGDKTVAALKDFQDRNDLSADGMCGEKTLNLLYSDDARESASLSKQKRTKANISNMISVAKKQLGKKYVLGAKGPDKFDCSGLVYYCLKQAGSNRRRLSAAGYSGVTDWEKITSINDLKRGDLIFFYSDDYSKVGHVGIVLNDTEMIDASSSNGKVVRRDYKTSYWKKHFYCGRRPW